MAKKYNTDEYKQIATPANPVGGFNKLYFKADNKAYRLDSTGVEVELGGSGSSAITTVADQAARLALSAAVNDIVSQVDTDKLYQLRSLPASTDANWESLSGSSGGVTIQSGTFIVNGLPTPSNTPTSGTDSDTYYSSNFNGLISIPDYTGTNPTPTLEITCTLFVKVNGINSPMIGQLSIG